MKDRSKKKKTHPFTSHPANGTLYICPVGNICPVADAEAFEKAVCDVIKHDVTEPVKLGEYTEE